MRKIVLVHIQNNIMIKDNSEHIELKRENMPEYLSNIISTTKEQTIMWVQDLNLYGKSIVKLLYGMNYEDQTLYNPPVKEMRQPGYKYICSDSGIYYNIIIRIHKKTVYIYNVNNLLSNLDNQETCNAWGETGQVSLKELADAAEKGIEMMNGWQSRKTPYTVSMVALRAWKSIEGLYQCPDLVNMRECKSPIQGMNLDDYIRKSYQSGWNYINYDIPREKYAHKGIKVYDVNSLYPWAAANNFLPWGSPTFFTGKPEKELEKDDRYYFIRIKIACELKPGSYPYIKYKGSGYYTERNSGYISTTNRIIYDRKGQKKEVKNELLPDGTEQPIMIELVLSKTDWHVIQRHYTIKQVKFLDGVWFRTCRCLFNDYVNYYYKIKSETKDPGMRRVSKMMQNGVIGTLAKKAERTNLYYDYDKSGNLEPNYIKSSSPSPSYIHIASSILSYAREKTYEAACANYEHFLYSDTDSLHIYGDEPVSGIEVDAKKLGAWKLEKSGDDVAYLKLKTYIIHNDAGYHITMCGVSHEYGLLIDDILSYMSDDYIQNQALAGKYGDDIKDIFEYAPRGEIVEHPITGKIYEVYEKPKTMDLLNSMITDINSCNDRIMSLLYTTYPSGAHECTNDDFNISYRTFWLSQSSREDLHIKDKMR